MYENHIETFCLVTKQSRCSGYRNFGSIVIPSLQKGGCALSPEKRVPEKHPLRDIKSYADQVLAGLTAEFNARYGKMGSLQAMHGSQKNFMEDIIFFAI
jgi:hypothetical protein